MKKLLTALFLALFAQTAFSQILFKLELLPDNVTYKVSMIPSQTWTFPQNLTASAQITIRAPHGLGPNSFQVSMLTMLTPGTQWEANARVNAPIEAPSWDYISFGLSSFGTDAYNYQAGVELPVFSFKNGAAYCADSIELVANDDPFFPPNSASANIGNYIVTLGSGQNNAFGGFDGDGKAPGTPQTLCTVGHTEVVQLCDGESFQDSVYLFNTSIEEHYTTAAGCDSAIVTAIKVGQTTTATIDTSVCQGHIFNGNPVMQDETETMTFINHKGCDSVVTYLVHVLMPATGSESVTLLQGQLYNGVPFFNDTTVVFTLAGANGCDSFATVNITMYDTPVLLQEENLCFGQTYQGVLYTETTSLIDTLHGGNGFDTILLTNIYVFPVYNIENTVSLCAGESYNGVVYNDDFTLTEPLQTWRGCDSTVVTHIEVVAPQVISLDTTLCAGETFLGFAFEEDTLLQTITLAVNGCDSIVWSANVKVNPVPIASITGETSLCHGPVFLKALGGATYQWSNGKNSPNIQASDPGDYTVTVSNGAGCEDVATVTVTSGEITVEMNITEPDCQGNDDGEILFSNPGGGIPPYAYSVDGGSFFTTYPYFNNLPPGAYEVVVKDGKGCVLQKEIVLSDPLNLLLQMGETQLIELGETVLLDVNTNLQNPSKIAWSPAGSLNCDTCLIPEATPLETTVYHLTLTDDKGCTLEGKIEVRVKTERRYFVPTAFSPNNDGINDLLFFFADDKTKLVRKMVIHDRWGAQVFAAQNFTPNNPTAAWTGELNGKPATEGVYTWSAEVEFFDGAVEYFQGTVAVVR
jgi:gliding motility-associated-like protein